MEVYLQRLEEGKKAFAAVRREIFRMNWRSDSEEARAKRTQLLLSVEFPYLGENQEICSLLTDLLYNEAKLRSCENDQADAKAEWSRAKLFMDLRMKYLDATLRPPCLFDVLPKEVLVAIVSHVHAMTDISNLQKSCNSLREAFEVLPKLDLSPVIMSNMDCDNDSLEVLGMDSVTELTLDISNFRLTHSVMLSLLERVIHGAKNLKHLHLMAEDGKEAKVSSFFLRDGLESLSLTNCDMDEKEFIFKIVSTIQDFTIIPKFPIEKFPEIFRGFFKNLLSMYEKHWHLEKLPKVGISLSGDTFRVGEASSHISVIPQEVIVASGDGNFERRLFFACGPDPAKSLRSSLGRWSRKILFEDRRSLESCSPFAFCKLYTKIKRLVLEASGQAVADLPDEEEDWRGVLVETGPKVWHFLKSMETAILQDRLRIKLVVKVQEEGAE